MTSVLIVLSAADSWTLKEGSKHPTGYWAEELVEPHRIFSAAGWGITIAPEIWAHLQTFNCPPFAVFVGPLAVEAPEVRRSPGLIEDSVAIGAGLMI